MGELDIARLRRLVDGIHEGKRRMKSASWGSDEKRTAVRLWLDSRRDLLRVLIESSEAVVAALEQWQARAESTASLYETAVEERNAMRRRAEGAEAEQEAVRRENQQLHEELDLSAGHTAEEWDADDLLAEYEQLLTPAVALAAHVDSLEAAWRSSSRNLEVAAQLGDPKARATIALLEARDALRVVLDEDQRPSDG